MLTVVPVQNDRSIELNFSFSPNMVLTCWRTTVLTMGLMKKGKKVKNIMIRTMLETKIISPLCFPADFSLGL